MHKKRIALALVKAGVVLEYLLIGVWMGLGATYVFMWNPAITIPVGIVGGLILLFSDPREWRSRSILAFRYHRAGCDTTDRSELPPQ